LCEWPFRISETASGTEEEEEDDDDKARRRRRRRRKKKKKKMMMMMMMMMTMTTMMMIMMMMKWPEKTVDASEEKSALVDRIPMGSDGIGPVREFHNDVGACMN
jgi:cation transport ATPase